ncbi:MAG: cation:proton antiporter [Ignavibacteria bacterium]|nr:cation:proton antiporter [Ignavibacteria bacterium]
MDNFSVIRDLTLILAVSLPVLFLFRKIKVSPVVGYLITGILIGPSGLHLLKQTGQIEVMAEIGIILLMFSVGLEFSLARLLRMKSFFIVFGPLQVIITFIASYFVLHFIGLSLQTGIFFSMIAALSSTAIVLKIYTDKGILDAPHGKVAVGILVFQDIAIIPMLLVLPLLRGGSELVLSAVLLQLVIAVLVIISIVALSRYIVPRLLFAVSGMRSREVFTATLIVLLLGTAYCTHLAGISFSIGAFIAGFIIADSDFATEIAAEILPMRDIFNSLFFVSAGLLLSVSALITEITLIATLLGSLILVKAVVVFAIVRFSGYPSRTAAISAFSLAQIGEFAFILFQSGLQYNIINAHSYNIALSVVILSMTLTPFFIEFIPYIADLINPASKDDGNNGENSTVKKLQNHVIIAGYGLNGKNLARVLKETGIPYIIIELNPDTVKSMREQNENILYGDITKTNILQKAGIQTAKVMVYAISDPHSTRTSVALAKKLNPSLHTIVRTRYVTEIEELNRLKADYVIPEEFETSLQIFSRVLQEFHIPMNIILRQINVIRQGGYELLRSEDGSISPMHLMDIIAKSVTETYFVEEHSFAVDKAIKEMDLRVKTGATILSIVRQDTAINNPSGNEVIRYGDVLVLTGTHQAVDNAIDLMQSSQ